MDPAVAFIIGFIWGIVVAIFGLKVGSGGVAVDYSGRQYNQGFQKGSELRNLGFSLPKWMISLLLNLPMTRSWSFAFKYVWVVRVLLLIWLVLVAAAVV